MGKIAVIILNYKTPDLTLKCVKSIKESTYKDYLLIVVDNNSNDGLVNELEDVKDITLIKSKENIGYSGGNNKGIKSALKAGADYIFILNPDTTIAKQAMSNLISFTKKWQADIVGPKIFFSRSKKIWYAGGIFELDNVLGKHRGVDEIDNGQYDQPGETDVVTGAAMFIKADVFKKIGFLDEKYFLYYEDSDFCFRAKKAGFKIMFDPGTIVYHENAKSIGLGSPLQDYYITKSRLLFASKFCTLRTKFALFREILHNISNSARRKALFDFMLGKFGRVDSFT